jgi:hypothetical protein
MNIAADPVGADFIKDIAQRRPRFLQAETLLLAARAENMDVVNDVVFMVTTILSPRPSASDARSSIKPCCATMTVVAASAPTTAPARKAMAAAI